MTHRLNLFLLVLALVIGAPYYWLLLDNPSTRVSPHALRLVDLRRLAESLPGARPTALAATIIAWDRTPGTFLAAGSGIKRRLYGVMSFRLEVPGRGPIVIDSGTTGRLAAARGHEAFDKRRQDLVDGDMRESSLIVATDESSDSLGGLAALAATSHPAPALSVARLNAAQAPTASRAGGLPWPRGLDLPDSLPPGGARALAPGVVLIPTGAPSPGSQMVYLRLANGREYLLAGPVAPYQINVTQLRTRSHLLDLLQGRQDGAGTMRWLVTIRDWLREDPDLYLVAGHDIMGLIGRDWPSGITNRERAESVPAKR